MEAHDRLIQALTDRASCRVAQRSAQADDASEADRAVLHGQLSALEPLTAEEHVYAVTIDTEAPQASQRLLETVLAIGEGQ